MYCRNSKDQTPAYCSETNCEFPANRLSLYTTDLLVANHINTLSSLFQTKPGSTLSNLWLFHSMLTSMWGTEQHNGAASLNHLNRCRSFKHVVFLATVILFIISVHSIFVLLTIASLQQPSLCTAAKCAGIKMLIWCH